MNRDSTRIPGRTTYTRLVDSSLMIGIAVAVGGVVALAWGIPAMLRDTRRRQERGESGLGGMTAGWDAVWAPTAHEADRERMAQNEAPAPAPSPGDKGDLDDGTIVIEIEGR